MPMVSEDGHVMGVLADITVELTGAGTAELFTIPNSWAFRNAVRRFHFARKNMFEESGIALEELGPYQRHMAFYMNEADALSETCDLLTLTAFQYKENESSYAETTFPGGDYEISTLANGQPVIDVSGTVEDMADSWAIHACGKHAVQGTLSDGTESYESVGMIQAYLEDRAAPTVADKTNQAGSEIKGENNPLARLSAQNVASQAVTEIAEDEMQAFPYDRGVDGARSLLKVGEIEVQGSQTLKQTIRNVFLPGGYLQITKSITDNVRVEVKAVMECREYTL